jgi:hypothetical protein
MNNSKRVYLLDREYYYGELEFYDCEIKHLNFSENKDTDMIDLEYAYLNNEFDIHDKRKREFLVKEGIYSNFNSTEETTFFFSDEPLDSNIENYYLNNIIYSTVVSTYYGNIFSGCKLDLPNIKETKIEGEFAKEITSYNEAVVKLLFEKEDNDVLNAILGSDEDPMMIFRFIDIICENGWDLKVRDLSESSFFDRVSIINLNTSGNDITEVYEIEKVEPIENEPTLTLSESEALHDVRYDSDGFQIYDEYSSCESDYSEEEDYL